METISNRFNELANLLPEFMDVAEEAISEAAIQISGAFQKGNKLLICGNGGSAADSQHFAAEFVNAFSRDLNRTALPAMALSTDTSVLTSIANDFEFQSIFSRQVSAYGRPGDVLVALTTSGESKNCLFAVDTANSLEMITIAFTKENALITKMAEISIQVPSQNTQHIQECHMLAYHVITELVEDRMFRKENK